MTKPPESIYEGRLTLPAFVWPVGILLLAGLALWMIISQVAGGQAQDRQVQARAAFAAATGIHVVRLGSTAAGGMIYFQFQAVDPDKSLIIHDDDNPPTLLHEKTGHTIARPLHDHSSEALYTGITYHILIVNEGGLIKPGDKVTLLLGEWQLEHLEVE